jgi:thioredoxin-related protein
MKKRPLISEKNTNSILKILKKEQKKVKELQELLSYFKDTYNVSADEIISSAEPLPISIFCTELTALEAIVKYCKECKGYSYHEIAEYLGRDERNVWHAYSDAQRKHKPQLVISESKFSVPISIFKSRLSIQESLVVYLKDHFHLNYHTIAVLLSRDDRTIWTAYTRGKVKR